MPARPLVFEADGCRAGVLAAGRTDRRAALPSGGGTSPSPAPCSIPRPETETLVAAGPRRTGAGDDPRHRHRQRGDPPDPPRRMALGAGRRDGHRRGGTGGCGGERHPSRGLAALAAGARRLVRRASAGPSTLWSRTRPTSPPRRSRRSRRTCGDWEPRHALTVRTDGARGLCADRRRPRGGPPPAGARCSRSAEQADAVVGLLAAAGLPGARVHRDLDGRDRVVAVGGSSLPTAGFRLRCSPRCTCYA